MSFVGGNEVSDNPLVRFLAAYGPIPAANNMYDEFVASESEKYGIRPLAIKEDVSERLVENFRSNHPKTIILTGTAGDGKTYTARQVYIKLGGNIADWNDDQPEIPLTIPDNGLTVIFVRDLSEMTAGEKARLLPRLRDALLQKGNEVFLVCVNDGHLLKTWREHIRDDDQSYMAFKEMLRQDSETSDSLPGLKLINMSRHCHAGMVDNIIDEITDHPGWDGCPKDCPAKDNDCPVLANRDILRQRGEASVRRRLTQLITLAATDGEHLSIRQLIIIVVNALLGYRDSSGKRTLLDCALARKCAAEGTYELTNPFSHIFGDNLPPNRRGQYQAFVVLSRFGIGDETTHLFDEALLRLTEQPELPDHSLYGERIFAPVRNRYLNDPNPDIAAFRQAIRTQRQRLFFSLPDDSNAYLLSLYRSAPKYLAYAEPSDKPPSKSFRQIVVKGFNRTLTYTLTGSSDKLWLIEPSGVLVGRDVPLVTVPPLEWQGSGFGPSMNLELPPEQGKAPALNIEGARLEITATLFEYLSRICDGALPTSFANQCLQDIRNFRLQAIGHLQQKWRNSSYLRLVDVSGEYLREESIRLLESEYAE